MGSEKSKGSADEASPASVGVDAQLVVTSEDASPAPAIVPAKIHQRRLAKKLLDIWHPTHWSGWLGAMIVGLILLFGNRLLNAWSTPKPAIRAEIRKPVNDFQKGTIQEFVLRNLGTAPGTNISIRLSNQLATVGIHCDGERYTLNDVAYNDYPLFLREIELERLAPRLVFTCQFALNGAGPLSNSDIVIVSDEGIISREQLMDYTENRVTAIERPK